MKNTITVLLCTLVIGVCIWVFDAVAVNFFRMIINVLGG
jgi:preprotein translocase subunit SecE